MELELKRNIMEEYRPNLHAAWNHEEIRECIVTDALPDISRVVSATGHVKLTALEGENGTVMLNGDIRASVLYVPEDDGSPRVLPVHIPFRCSKDDPRVTGNSVLQGNVWLVGIDPKLLNPRKVLLRIGLCCQIDTYEKVITETVSDTAEQCDCVEKRKDRVECCCIREVTEKRFTFSDVLRTSSGKPPVEELLYFRPEFGPPEAKVIGRKLVCKGELILSALYRSGSEIHHARFELPYSQVMELSHGYEEGTAGVNVLPGEVQVTARDGEVEVWAEAVIQGLIRSSETLELLTDAYSFGGELETERSAYSLTVSVKQDSKREQVRYFCETGIPAGQVLDCQITAAEQAEEMRDGEKRHCCTFRADILYLSEDRALCCVSYNIPCETALPEESDFSRTWSCRTAEEGTAVPVTGGLELRFQAEFKWEDRLIREVLFLSGAELSADREEASEKPSLVLYAVSDGEDLWSVSKLCRASIADVCAVNGSEAEHLRAGTVLLIPTKRTV